MHSDYWKVKVAAWCHDPAEKAFVLMRGSVGHEDRTVADLRKRLFGEEGLSSGLLETVKRADRWAAAADRPQFPLEKEAPRFHAATQIRFDKQPVLIHPLSGEQYSLSPFVDDVDREHIEAVSFDHFERLIISGSDGRPDYRKTHLAFWRLGPRLRAPDLGALWQMLPADTRVPDHPIWDHLRLTSALAGAMHEGDGPALLLVSFGPVQSFIAQARSTSDLWAGSHLLSRLAWEALKTLCIELGPDCVIFPDLHGLPLADVWLLKEGVLVREGPDPGDVRTLPPDLRRESDANPLYIAALPNRFVAAVPRGHIKELVEQITEKVRSWVHNSAAEAIRKLFSEAGGGDPTEAHRQAERQLAQFPEIYWSAMPWLEAEDARKALAMFYPDRNAGDPGFFGTDAWRLLSGELNVEGARFYSPNPGVIYPAIWETVERAHGSAKALRAFAPTLERGFRCSLCGEREWLTEDRRNLDVPRGQRKDTVWIRVARKRPAWSRRGEHLCALCALKRLWPDLFNDEIESALDIMPSRYVISTHTMALAPTLDRLVERLCTSLKPEEVDARDTLRQRSREELPVALPRRIARQLREADLGPGDKDLVRRLPGLLDTLAEEGDNGATRMEIEGDIKALTGARPERYYALVLMDGDWMGKWLSGKAHRLSYGDTWHPQVREHVRETFANQDDIIRYLRSYREPSPAYHIALSRALNGFALLAPGAVEDAFKGKLLYAGGDDLMALVSVDDLLGLLLFLRCLYSGVPRGARRFWEALGCEPPFEIGGGHALRGRELIRLMGFRASLSAGAVVAHHTAPLGAVLRELRAAERRAKSDGGKNAFSVSLMKRGGGLSHFTSPWFLPEGEDGSLGESSIGILLKLRDAFARHLSRRAAYHLLEWLPGIPEDGPEEMLQTILAYQFKRQAKRRNKPDADGKGFDPTGLSSILVRLSGRVAGQIACTRSAFLRDAITLTEFLAREGRAAPEERANE